MDKQMVLTDPEMLTSALCKQVGSTWLQKEQQEPCCLTDTAPIGACSGLISHGQPSNPCNNGWVASNNNNNNP
jgi:hypothetical protein